MVDEMGMSSDSGCALELFLRVFLHVLSNNWSIIFLMHSYSIHDFAVLAYLI